MGTQPRQAMGILCVAACLFFTPFAVKAVSLREVAPIGLTALSADQALPRRCIAQFGSPGFRFAVPVYCLSYSSDGNVLAVAGGGYYHDSSQKKIHHWDIHLISADKGHLLRRLIGHKGIVYSIAFDSQGTFLASASQDGTIRIWDPETGKELFALQQSGGPVREVAFSPSQKVLGFRANDSRVRLWNYEARKYVGTLDGSGIAIWSFAFSPDGRTMATGMDDNSVWMWDLATFRITKKLSGPDSPVKCVLYSPSGLILACGDLKSTIQLFDPKTGTSLPTIKGHRGSLESIAFSPNGRVLASSEGYGSENYSIRLWDVATGRLMKELIGHSSWVSSIAFSPNGEYLASGSWDTTIGVWDVSTGRERRPFQGHRAPIRFLNASADGRHLVSGGEDQKIILWDMKERTERWQIKSGQRIMTDAFWLRRSDKVVSFGEDRTIRVFSPGERKELLKISLQEETLCRAVDEKDDVVLWSTKRGIVVWDVRERRETLRLRFSSPKETAYLAVAFGKIACFDGGPTLSVWNRDTGQKLAELGTEREQGNVTGCFLDRSLLVSAGENRVVLWDLEKKKVRREVALERQEPLAFAVFSRDGRLLSSYDRNGVIRLYEVASGEEIATWQVPSLVKAMTFSADGKILATGGEGDFLTFLWDVTDSTERTAKLPQISREEAQRLWRALHEAKARRANAIIWQLAECPDVALDVAQGEVQKTCAPTPEALRKSVGELDHPDYYRRQAANGELERLQELALPALERELGKAGLSLESRKRIEVLVEKMNSSSRYKGVVRQVRVLEAIGNARAKALLGELTKGSPEAWATQEATMALHRMRSSEQRTP